MLTYWYGNVPEETEYFIHRIQQPWLTLVILAPLFNFVIPMFALDSKGKQMDTVGDDTCLCNGHCCHSG